VAVALDAALRATALHDAEGRLLRTLGDLVASLTPIDVTASPTGALARPAKRRGPGTARPAQTARTRSG